MPLAYSNPPKNIQEGTANQVKMIVNELEAGNPKEAGYIAIDLLDELVSGALVVTKRTPPLDHANLEAIRREEYARGVADGRKQAYGEAHKSITARVTEALTGAVSTNGRKGKR